MCVNQKTPKSFDRYKKLRLEVCDKNAPYALLNLFKGDLDFVALVLCYSANCSV